MIMTGWEEITGKYTSWQNSLFIGSLMKRNYLLLLFILAFIALLSGSLTKGISFVGRTGISLFYKEYKFFKVWWQSALVCFALFLVIAIILYFVDKSLTQRTGKTVLLACFFVFLAGLYFTFRNFRADISMKWLGERFHLGIYLYWIGFCIISLFYFATHKK